MGPREFCRLTWKQYDLLVDAAIKKRDADKHFWTSMTANLMNVQLSRGHVTAEQLLGKGPPRRAKVPGKSFAEMDELQRAAALEAIRNRANRPEQKRGKQASTKTEAVRK